MGLCNDDVIRKYMTRSAEVYFYPAILESLKGNFWLSLYIPVINELPCGRRIDTPEDLVSILNEEEYWVYYSCNSDGINTNLYLAFNDDGEISSGASHYPHFFVPYSFITNHNFLFKNSIWNMIMNYIIFIHI